MADATAEEGAEEPPAKKGGKGLLFGLIAAVLLGAGGFFLTFSGILALPFGGAEDPQAAEHAPAEAEAHAEPEEPVAFLPLDDLVISLGTAANARHLQFAGQLEITPEHEAEVAQLKPRVLDVVNTYLRAVEARDLADPAAMGRIRAQLLRRIQIVTGEGRVRDLLITQFVLN